MATPRKRPDQKQKVGRKLFDGQNPGIVMQKLEQAWSIEASDAEAAFFAGISAAALCKYLKDHPEVSERKEQLKTKVGFKAKLAIASGVADPDRALKYLERKQPKEYAPLTKQANTDNEGKNITPIFSAEEAKL